MTGQARPMYYKLDSNKIPIPCFDVMEWAVWFGKADRGIADDAVGDFWIVTGFLGLDLALSGSDPVLFETMVAHPKSDRSFRERYRTWGEAAAGHERIVSMLRYEREQEKA